MEKPDIIIIGAGIVGLAIATALSQKDRSIILIEKENSFGQHASSRNSEIIHSGIYYKKDSLKATLCVEEENSCIGSVANRISPIASPVN